MGKVDAVWIFGAPDAPAVHSLLHNPNIRLIGFQAAEALTRIFPELTRLVLPQGVIDFDRNIPPNDVPLIGSTTKVLVRSDLHPEIVQLLLQTMVEAHSGVNIFQRAGEFPNSTDVEYPVAPAAIDFCKNGPKARPARSRSSFSYGRTAAGPEGVSECPTMWTPGAPTSDSRSWEPTRSASSWRRTASPRPGGSWPRTGCRASRRARPPASRSTARLGEAVRDRDRGGRCRAGAS